MRLLIIRDGHAADKLAASLIVNNGRQASLRVIVLSGARFKLD